MLRKKEKMMNSFPQDNESTEIDEQLNFDELTGGSQTDTDNSTYKLEELLLEKKQADSQVFAKYLEVVEALPLKLINDDEFLAATDHLNTEEFLQAVFRAYFKRDITPLELPIQMHSVGNGKDNRRSYLTLGIRKIVETSQLDNSENFTNSIGQFFKRIQSILLRRLF